MAAQDCSSALPQSDKEAVLEFLTDRTDVYIPVDEIARRLDLAHFQVYGALAEISSDGESLVVKARLKSDRVGRLQSMEL